MAPEQQRSPNRRRMFGLISLAFFVGVILMAGLAALLVNIQERRFEATEFPMQIVQIPEDELDPAVWGLNFPRQYSTFMRTQDDTISTPYGGSVPYSKLERNPRLVRLWAGYAFAKDHNEERGHYYAQIDQAISERVQIVAQPGACINCHAAEAPQLIAEMGWEEFNRTPYLELQDKLHLGTSCADCHTPNTMELRITRPALLNALEVQGIDITQATRQEMRTYVCAQCHVEYYFLGEDRILTYPWSQGLTVEDVEAHYDTYGFADWRHAETNAPMIKIQHPEYELWSTGLHARAGVSCADCHMPYVRDGAVKVSDHWIRSPLVNLSNACQTCHRIGEDELRNRVLIIQTRTANLLHSTEEAIIDAIDAIVAATAAGATEEQLEEPRYLQRRASLRWDFVHSENSTGFHSPQESARILADAIDMARQAQILAERAMAQPGATARVQSE
jgi:nitrite reductase (cytochrome c-552)